MEKKILKKKKIIYCMPGMAAKTSIFNGLSLEDYVLHLIEWEMPLPKESLQEYAKRISEKIPDEKPILLGVSFGAIIVQEIAKIRDYSCLIVISSVKTKDELPPRMRLAQKTNLHKILPTNMISNKKIWDLFSFIKIVKHRQKLYEKYMGMNSPEYLDWAIDCIVNWQQTIPLPRTIHIHGEKDWVFPIKYIKNPIVVSGASHIMIINRYNWFNQHLPKLLEKY